MPIGTGIVTTPVQPQTAKPSAKTEQRSVSGQSAAFSPRTDLAINNAVTDLSSVLAKILAAKQGSIDKMPPEIKQLVDELMQNAFSMEKMLLKGLGTALQNRRYAFAQLSNLGKLLTQLGNLSEKGQFTHLPQNIKTLLMAFRSLVLQHGQNFDNVDLLRNTFALLNDKKVQDVPPALRQFFTPTGSAPQGDTKLPPTAQQLKEVFTKFFNEIAPPSGKAATTPQQTSGSNAANNAASNAAATTQEQAAMQTASQDAPASTATAAQTNKQAQAAATGTATHSSTTNNNPPHAAVSPQTAAQAAPNEFLEQVAQNAYLDDAPLNNEQPAGQIPANTTNTNANAKEVVQNGAQQQAAAVAAGKNSTAEAAAPLLNNDFAAIQTLRNLAAALDQQTLLNPKTKQLLQNFVNDSSTSLNNDDFQQLQLALRTISQNMPGLITQAAARHSLPNLPKLWAFMQLCDLATVNEHQAAALQKSGESIEAFAKMAGRTYFADAATAHNAAQRSLDFMLPLYLDPHTSYPAYFNIYNDEHQNTNGNNEVTTTKETWLRVCCLTEHIGAVETVLCLYNNQSLSVRLMFSDEATAVSFEEFLPSLRAYLYKEKFNLTDLKIATIDQSS